MVPSGIRFLAGAPEASTLDWSDTVLVSSFTVPIQRYLCVQPVFSGTPATQGWSDWRAIPLKKHMFYQSPLVRKSEPTAHIEGRGLHKPAVRGLLDRDEDFLDHSFAVHTTIQSSQLAPQLGQHVEDEPTFVTENTEMSTFLEEDSTVLSADSALLGSPQVSATPVETQAHSHFGGPIMSIRSIPNADHLTRLQPQTMTVNLVAGVISISPTRTVSVRRGNYDMDIVEIILGDDTKAGFTLSSWHVPVRAQHAPDALRRTILNLRPQDIVLVERLALSSFRGQVFGQSLNRKTSKITTNITVLCKSEALHNVFAYHGSNLPLHLAAKLQRVKDWVASFIGPSNRRNPEHGNQQYRRKRKQPSEEQDEFLPPDSQT